MNSAFGPFIGKINGNLTDYGFKITADFCISESEAISFVPNVTTTSLDGVCSFFIAVDPLFFFASPISSLSNSPPCAMCAAKIMKI